MPRRALLGLLLLTGLLTAGCGKSNPTGGSPATVVAVRTAPSVPGVAPGGGGSRSKAQAEAFVAAVNLTSADVPGLRVTREARPTPDARERVAQGRLLGCLAPGTHAGGPALAEGGSGTFRATAGLLQASVSSDVSVGRGSGAARLELKLLRSVRSRACLSRYVGQLLVGKPGGLAAVKKIAIAQGQPPAPGTSGGYGWRITATLAAGRIDVPLYMDILGFVDGPADVTLISTGFPVPFPASEEERLFSLLVERASSSRP